MLPSAWPSRAISPISVRARVRSTNCSGRLKSTTPYRSSKKKGVWYRFKDFEGDEGWIHASLLDMIHTVIVRVRRCNVRSGPSTDTEIAFTVDRGIPFKVLQKKGRWFEVEHSDGDKGWIFETLVW